MPTTTLPLTDRDPKLGASFPVSLVVFDGPLDLLLHLIERNELDISEVSLCEVTEQYLRAVERLAHIDPNELADFLSIASRLTFIKSSRVLPRPSNEDDEEESAGDELVRQLIEYRRFRRAAESLKLRSDRSLRAHVRAPVQPVVERPRNVQPDLSDVDADRLNALLRTALQRIPIEPPAPRVAAYRVTVAEQVNMVRSYVRRIREIHSGRRRVLFLDILGTAYSRTEVIVTFLAVLELIKLQEVAVVQDATFGDIYLVPVKSEGYVAEQPGI